MKTLKLLRRIFCCIGHDFRYMMENVSQMIKHEKYENKKVKAIENGSFHPLDWCDEF